MSLSYSIEWKDLYSAGYEEVDLQHRELISIANKLFMDMASGRGIYTIETLMERLERFVYDHFTLEEDLMENYSYPRIDIQKEKHREFCTRFTLFKRRMEAGDYHFALDLYYYLQEWIEEHFDDEDQELGTILLAWKEKER